MSFTQTPLFSLGSVAITTTANGCLDLSEVQVAIRRHCQQLESKPYSSPVTDHSRRVRRY